MTPRERADSYNKAFPKFPPLRADARWIDGIWFIGNDYRGSGYYGSYPPSYLKRVQSLFPDVAAKDTLHVFSGSLKEGWRVDRNPANKPTVVADAIHLPFKPASFKLVFADPPYGPEHAKRYGYPMVNRRLVLRELWETVVPGGHVVWLDVMPPMFASQRWHWMGAIGLVRSTNHLIRLVTILERK